jgi:1,4-dihydroxy-2-naphthoyl-CoA hydrolase
VETVENVHLPSMTSREADPQLTETLHATVPFSGQLGLEVVEASARRVIAQTAWAPERCTAGGVLHGGVVMSAADTVAAICAFMNLPEDAVGTTTIEAKTNFLAAVHQGTITFTAEPIHVGRTTIVLQIDARDEEDQLISRSTQTQSVLAAASS